MHAPGAVLYDYKFCTKTYRAKNLYERLGFVVIEALENHVVMEIDQPAMTLRFDVFGRHVLVAKVKDGWVAYYQGSEGKKRLATDIVVPADICESKIEQYLADLCHEWASERYPNVKRLD